MLLINMINYFLIILFKGVSNIDIYWGFPIKLTFSQLSFV